LSPRSTNRNQAGNGPFTALPSLFPRPALIVAGAALLVIVPMFFLGTPSGHDFEFHMNSWMEVLSQWKQGILYPRWAAQAHFGYGAARFLFYPPASWVLGALLGAVLPWNLVPGAFIWIALTAAGWSMFLLARTYLSPRDAILAAVLYTANPYHFVIVYWRSAYAELLVAWLLPLLLLLVLRAEQQGSRIIVPLALVVAAAWLTNAPAAVMVNYSLALLVFVIAISRRAPRLLRYGAAAVVLGAALASFYVLPAAYEEKWVNIAQVLSPGVRPQDNFLFTIMNDADHNRFNYLVSTVAVSEMLLVVAAAFLSRKYWRHRPDLWWVLAAWASTTMLLMCSFTLFFWEHLPKLRFVQLPWRWLLCLNVAFALFVTGGTRRRVTRLVICLCLAGVVVAVWHRIQAPWWDSADDIAEMRDNFQNGSGYEGTDEYVPAGADAYEIKKGAPRVSWRGPGTMKLHEKAWGVEEKHFMVSVSEPGSLVLRLFNFPSWKTTVNQHKVAAETTEETGQMVIPIPAGRSDIEIVLVRTWDRTLGAAISLLALAITIGLLWTERRRGRAG
jgi:hypothetical protein